MRKFISLLASLALVASLMAVTAAPVAAADYGPCRDDSTRYFVAGENFSATGLYGVEAYINPASGFHMCTPAESSITDQNASVLHWGSIGFIISVASLGPVMDLAGPSWLPPVLLLLFAAIWFSSLSVPESSPTS